ncbi:MAG: GAF domain-containing protein [Phycisphaerales bacterium JB059]
MHPPLSPDEPFRLEALRELQLVDTPLEASFERITRMAQRMLGMPIAALSLVEADRQWFKSIQGLDCEQTDRDAAFCAYTILGNEPVVVQDARQDPRFERNPLVTGEPFIVSYAGAPVRAPGGMRIGSLCVIGRRPREFTPEDIEVLEDLAAVAEAEFESVLRRVRTGDAPAPSPEERRKLVDSTTRLWNREGVMGQAEASLRRVAGSLHGAAIGILQIDNLEQIHAERGSEGRDEALRVGAKRVLASAGESSVVGRLRNGRFMVLLNDVSSLVEAGVRMARIGASVRRLRADSQERHVRLAATTGFCYIEPGRSIDVHRALRIAGRGIDPPHRRVA